MSYYRQHVFFCINERDPSATRPSCAHHNAVAMQAYAKEKMKSLGLPDADQIRINKAGCMERCEEGPVLVIYPDAVWYTYIDESDIDEIIQSHIIEGKHVERLKI